MSSDVPDAGYLAALAGFDRMTVGRLRHLVRGRPAPEAYGMAAGTHRPSPAIAAVFAKDCTLAEAWRQSAQRRDPRECWEASVAAGVRVLTPADPSVPPQLSTDPACPAVLFVRSNLGAL
ncbi:MAG: hypothetical protein P8L16_07330, partial [Ilumatobacter sp.]|nr:hypothetical protein [Ilumatobacter sp.]